MNGNTHKLTSPSEKAAEVSETKHSNAVTPTLIVEEQKSNANMGSSNKLDTEQLKAHDKTSPLVMEQKKSSEKVYSRNEPQEMKEKLSSPLGEGDKRIEKKSDTNLQSSVKTESKVASETQSMPTAESIKSHSVNNKADIGANISSKGNTRPNSKAVVENQHVEAADTVKSPIGHDKTGIGAINFSSRPGSTAPNQQASESVKSPISNNKNDVGVNDISSKGNTRPTSKAITENQHTDAAASVKPLSSNNKTDLGTANLSSRPSSIAPSGDTSKKNKLSSVKPLLKSEAPIKVYRLFPSVRFLIALVGSLGFVNLYTLKAYLSLAIVCMINNTALAPPKTNLPAANSSTIVCEITSHGASIDGPFIWYPDLKGIILGSFFYGYLLTQLIGGYLAEKYGGKHVLGWFMFITISSSFLIPVLTKIHYGLLIALRILQGLGEGVVFPACHALWANWAPPLERSRLIGLTYAGAQLGSVIVMPISGYLCPVGWDYIFYFFGGFGMIWFILWMIIVRDNPKTYPHISNDEKEYIVSTVGDMHELRKTREVLGTPVKSILTSTAVWAIVVGHVGSNWGTYLMLTSLPTYMASVLKFDIHSNGIFSALPFLTFWGMIVLSSFVADKLRANGVRTVIVRKSMYFIGSVVPAGLIILMTFLDCSQAYGAVGVLIVGIGFFGLQYPGCLVNHVDIAPPFAGLLFGISNTFATVPGIVAPYVVGILAPQNTAHQWQLIAYITAIILVTCAIVFILLASGEVEDWAEPYMVKHDRRVSSLMNAEQIKDSAYSTSPHKMSLAT